MIISEMLKLNLNKVTSYVHDIPTLSAEAAKQHPGVSYIITAPLGLHVLLVDIVNDRINDCLKQAAGDAADGCSVCDGTGKCTLHQEAESQRNV
ncbi:sirohydrochlorin ferrochelatase-like [Trifolium medium]|uniref:Sirohydrochlorin ferrochelatase-like n=1 Tax=Trifolium medium TaxID=97028 RepID=A0A392MLL4_9FABA|nr:sirohydrochlorin ferrochelatase-like [Trifolium medium]